MSYFGNSIQYDKLRFGFVTGLRAHSDRFASIHYQGSPRALRPLLVTTAVVIFRIPLHHDAGIVKMSSCLSLDQE
jgi:hypothetical protein